MQSWLVDLHIMNITSESVCFYSGFCLLFLYTKRYAQWTNGSKRKRLNRMNGKQCNNDTCIQLTLIYTFVTCKNGRKTDRRNEIRHTKAKFSIWQRYGRVHGKTNTPHNKRIEMILIHPYRNMQKCILYKCINMHLENRIAWRTKKNVMEKGKSTPFSDAFTKNRCAYAFSTWQALSHFHSPSFSRPFAFVLVTFVSVEDYRR